ncbi:MAG: SH3 domain-containing protein [Saprospiraceae bacterium]|nr:SH3 domain-containing protein [Saprospiraceae bacterium]
MKLPKAETLILLAFLVCALLWGFSKCAERRSGSVRQVREIEGSDAEDRPAKPDTASVSMTPKTAEKQEKEHPEMPKPAAQTQTAEPAPKTGPPPKRPELTNDIKKADPPPAKEQSTAKSSGSNLFVSIDGLKVRKEPGLKGETLETLKLYDQVTFLNKKTDWTQEISLGYEKVTDHWVKVRTKSGIEGWVFGAGVHYYKTKRQGVLDDKKTPEQTKKKNR